MHFRIKPSSIILLVLLLGWWQGAAAQETLSFDTLIPREDYHLNAHFFEAYGEGPFPIAILLQGLLGPEGDVLGLGNRLSQAGIQVLTFNFSGIHSSGGQWTMANDLSDVRAVYEYVHEPDVIAHHRIDTTRVFLGGHSHGGGVALLYAADHPEVKNVFSISGNEFGEWARRLSRDSAFAHAINGVFQSYIAKGWMRIAEGADRELLDNVEKYDISGRRLSRLANRNIFLLGGLNDRTITMEEYTLPLYRGLQQEGAERVRFIVYQTDHVVSGMHGRLAEDLIDWIRASR